MGEVWAAVSREALGMIFEGADGSGQEEDAKLTAMWLWTLSHGANGGSFDDHEAVADEGSLAQSLSALYPSGSEERRWVEGVLARKKGLGRTTANSNSE